MNYNLLRGSKSRGSSFHRKGQIQMGETIFIVIFIILIIVFGLVFFSQAEGEEFRDQQKKFRELDSLVAAQYVASLTELKCSIYETEDISCFDRIKIISFANLTQNHWDLVGEYYVGELGTAEITIAEIYPNPQNWTIYNYTGALDTENRSYGARQTQIPITIFDPILNRNAFGVIYLTIYGRII